MSISIIVVWIIAVAVYIVFDYLWLRFLLGAIIKKDIHEFRAKNENTWLIVFSWILIILGILMLTFFYSSGKVTLFSAFFWGLVMGFFIFTTYNFISLILIRSWSVTMAIIDTFWGMFLCGVVSVCIAVMLKVYV